MSNLKSFLLQSQQPIPPRSYDIVGKPKIVNNVVSDFSSNDYVKISSADTTKNWVLDICFTTPKSIIEGFNTTLFYVNNNSSIKTNVKMVEYANYYNLSIDMTSDGSNYNIASDSHFLPYSLDINKTYYLRITFDKTKYCIYFSYNGITYNLIKTFVSSQCWENNDIIFGKALDQYSYSWHGSINMNYTYTQNLVGYTVVGSPTITDGVLIAPTDKENTIKTTEALDVGDESFEMQFCILNPTKKGVALFRVNGNNNTRCTFSSTNTFNLYPDYQTDSSVVLRALGTFWNNVINNSEQKVYLKVACLGKNSNNEYPFVFSCSTDGITWQTKTVMSSLPLATGVIMYCSSWGSYPSGSSVEYDLDLKETWIKINNKLWFNGQEG